MADNITVEINDKDLMKWLKKTVLKLKNPTEMFASIAARAEQDVFQHFDVDKRSSDGTPWPKAKYPPSKGSTLVRGGDLRRSITKRSDNKGAEVFTNLVYAAVHNFGGKVKERKTKGGKPMPIMTSKGLIFRHHAKAFKMPKREFLWIGDTAISQIEKAVLNEIAGD